MSYVTMCTFSLFIEGMIKLCHRCAIRLYLIVHKQVYLFTSSVGVEVHGKR